MELDLKNYKMKRGGLKTTTPLPGTHKTHHIECTENNIANKTQKLMLLCNLCTTKMAQRKTNVIDTLV